MSNKNIFELGNRGFNVPQWIQYFNEVSSENEASSSRSTTSGSEQRSGPCTSRCAVWSFVATALFILLLGASCVPLILYLMEEDQFKYYRATATLRLQGQYDKRLGNLSSTTSKEFQKDFCNTMENTQKNKYSNDYQGCLVTEIRNGSIIVSFSMFFYTKVIVTSDNVKTEMSKYFRARSNVTFANVFNVLIEIETLDVGVSRQEQIEYANAISKSQFVTPSSITSTVQTTTVTSTIPEESTSNVLQNITTTRDGSISVSMPIESTTTQADTTASNMSTARPTASTLTTPTTTLEGDTSTETTTTEDDTTLSDVPIVQTTVTTFTTQTNLEGDTSSLASSKVTTVIAQTTTSESESTENISLISSTISTDMVSEDDNSEDSSSTASFTTAMLISSTESTHQDDSISAVTQTSTAISPQSSSTFSTNSPSGNSNNFTDSSTETGKSTTLDFQDSTSTTSIPKDASDVTSELPDSRTSSSWNTETTSPTSINKITTTEPYSDDSTTETDFPDLNVSSSTIPSVTNASNVNVSDSSVTLTYTTTSPQQFAVVAMDHSYGEIGKVVEHTCRIDIRSGEWEQVYLRQSDRQENLAVYLKNGNTVIYTNDSILTAKFEADTSWINASVNFNLTEFPSERCGSRQFEFVCSVQMKHGYFFNTTASFTIIAPMTPPAVTVRATKHVINITSNETFAGVLISCNATKDQSNDSAQDVGIQIFNSTDHKIAEFVYFPDRSGIYTSNCGEWVFVHETEPTVFSYRSDLNGSTLYCFLQNAGAGNKVVLSNSVTLTFGTLETET
ncbi:uncharacterized protein LOC134263174 isoform X2 [Saccostrea cucullata]|uniref:uncharacterized protein LOC134263174 isoform X2 n=1 Tax=Saccostrea cuccullata TaxID=36930 RepID=UPI002ED06A84